MKSQVQDTMAPELARRRKGNPPLQRLRHPTRSCQQQLLTAPSRLSSRHHPSLFSRRTAGCTQASIEVPEPAAPDVGIQLFQLPWTSVAKECETTLAPAGIAWVLLSPAQEHIAADEWWASYQPVSYQLESRLGTRDEFADMVQRCNAVGVMSVEFCNG